MSSAGCFKIKTYERLFWLHILLIQKIQYIKIIFTFETQTHMKQKQEQKIKTLCDFEISKRWRVTYLNRESTYLCRIEYRKVEEDSIGGDGHRAAKPTKRSEQKKIQRTNRCLKPILFLLIL